MLARLCRQNDFVIPRLNHDLGFIYNYIICSIIAILAVSLVTFAEMLLKNLLPFLVLLIVMRELTLSHCAFCRTLLATSLHSYGFALYKVLFCVVYSLPLPAQKYYV